MKGKQTGLVLEAALALLVRSALKSLYLTDQLHVVLVKRRLLRDGSTFISLEEEHFANLN